MNTIIKSVGTLCIIGYITGLLMNFTTINHTQKAIRLICVLYIISAVLTPLTNFDFTLDITPPAENVEIIINTQEYVISKASEEIKNRASSMLNEKNISYTGINVHINKQTDGLAIESITIQGVDNRQREMIYKILEEITTREKINFGD